MENSTHLCPGVDSLTKEDILELVRNADKNNPYREIAGNVDFPMSIYYIDKVKWHHIGSLDEFELPNDFVSIMFYYQIGTKIFNFFVISLDNTSGTYEYVYDDDIADNFRLVLTRERLGTFLSA